MKWCEIVKELVLWVKDFDFAPFTIFTLKPDANILKNILASGLQFSLEIF